MKVDLSAYLKSAPNCCDSYWIKQPKTTATHGGVASNLNFFGTNDAALEVAGLVCPFSSSLHILTPGILESWELEREFFFVKQKIGSKKWRQAFLGTFFCCGCFIYV